MWKIVLFPILPSCQELNFGHYWHSARCCVKFSHIIKAPQAMGRHPPCSRLGWPLSQPVGLCSSVASVLPSGYPVFWQCLELFYTALPPEGKLEMWFWGTWLTVEHFTIRASRMNSLLFIPEKSEFHYKTVYIKLLIKHLGWLLESKRPSGTIPRTV